MMKSTTFIKVMVPVMRFTKLLRLIKFARPPARLPLSKLPTKHPHFTGEQHLGIIPLVSLGSSLNFINCPCFSCFSTPAEDLSWSRETCTFANLSTWHKSTEMIPNLSSYKKLSSSSWPGWPEHLFCGLISESVGEVKQVWLLAAYTLPCCRMQGSPSRPMATDCGLPCWSMSVNNFYLLAYK